MFVVSHKHSACFLFFPFLSFGLVVCGLCWCFVLLLVGVVFLLCTYSVLIEKFRFQFQKKKKEESYVFLFKKKKKKKNLIGPNLNKALIHLHFFFLTTQWSHDPLGPWCPISSCNSSTNNVFSFSQKRKN